VAGAGTGKTRVLVERYLRLLETEKLWPEDIAAITFTEKAAAEMMSKIRTACAERAATATTEASRQLWTERRDRLEAGLVSTIHGFCASLIRQHPVEAGVDPRFAIITDADQRQLLTDCLHATVRRLLDEDNADLLAMARAYGLRRLVQMLGIAVSRRSAVGRAASVLDCSVDEMVDRLRREVERVSGQGLDGVLQSCEPQVGLLQASRGQEGDRLETARVQATESLAMMAAGQPLAVRLDGLRVLAGVDLRGGSKKAWFSAELMASVKLAIDTLREAAREALKQCDISDSSHWPEEVELARSVLRTALAATEDYHRAKVERSVLDYDDLMIVARDTLRDHPGVRQACGRRFRQVMVDELQDTDELQMEIVQLLLGDEAETFAPRPGSFFGVGDPKQSIYRFRGAEVAVFRRVAEALGRRGGTLPLSRTFRFHRGLTGVTNSVFAPLLGEDFAALDSDRTDTPPVSMEVLLTSSGGEKQAAEDGRFREAARIAHRIRRLVDEEGLRFADVAILMHRQTTSYPYEDALARLGIPFFAVGARRFYEQEEIRDAVAALQVLRNPGDESAVAALLRGPLFALSDDGLYRLCRQGRLPEAIHDPAAWQSLSPQDADKAARAKRWMEHFAGRVGRVGVARLVEEVIFDGPGGSQGGLAHVLLPGFLGERRYANLRRLMDKARQADAAGGARLESFLESLESGVGEGVEEAEAALSAEGADVVRLMTVHKAKGLEFPCVILANADAARLARSETLYLSATLGLAPCRPDRRRNAVDSAAYTLLRAEDRVEEEQEFRRLFYVAATRAKDRLIVSGSQPVRSGSWLARLSQSFGTDLNDEVEGSRTVCVAPGANVLIDTAPCEPAPLSPRRVTGRLGHLFSRGELVPGAVKKQLAARVPAAARRIAELAVAKVRPDFSRPMITATALADYERCPALFYYRHGLRMGEPPRPASVSQPTSAGPSVPATAIGDVVHQYLCEADFTRQQADRAVLVRLTSQHPAVTPKLREAAVSAAESIVNKFLAMPLAEDIARSTEVLREAPFVLMRQGVTISGTIDLLYRNASDEWVLVDYKTDLIRPEEVQKRAEASRMQVAVYVEAVSEFLGTVLKNACLAFLRPGIIWYMKGHGDGEPLKALLSRLCQGEFPQQEACTEDCAYHPLCRRSGQP
jgi:ATP-dependent helicase/nuclease subunit A